VGALFAWIGFLSSVKRFESRHFWIAVILGISLIGFGIALYFAGLHLGNTVGPTLQTLEAASSP
jgi:hypothetical protein